MADFRYIHIPENVLALYPEDRDIKKIGAVSYIEVPLLDVDGRVLGHMAVLDTRPMPEKPRNLALFRIFAARGIKLEEVKSTLEDDLDLHGFLGWSEGVRPGYENIRVTFQVKGDGSTEELTELTKYSPVFDVVSKSVPVSVRVEKKETTVAR